jgi:hypothetical protein
MKLGDFSPLAGMATGEGLMGKLMRKGFGGAIPSAIARDAHASKERERQAGAAPTGEAPTAAMRKGGVVKASASRRADGCAQRGKTRGKVV